MGISVQPRTKSMGKYYIEGNYLVIIIDSNTWNAIVSASGGTRDIVVELHGEIHVKIPLRILNIPQRIQQQIMGRIAGG